MQCVYSTMIFEKARRLEVDVVYFTYSPFWIFLAELDFSFPSVACHSYIWRHLDIGYVQGMCDLLAPLLVVLDDGESTPSPASHTFLVFLQKSLPWSLAHSSFRFSEAKAFSCFTQLMKRMNQNFPHGGAMDTHFANMRSLIQVSQPQQRSAHITTRSICDHSQSLYFFCL